MVARQNGKPYVVPKLNPTSEEDKQLCEKAIGKYFHNSFLFL